jgi:hypothetical protein
MLIRNKAASSVVLSLALLHHPAFATDQNTAAIDSQTTSTAADNTTKLSQLKGFASKFDFQASGEMRWKFNHFRNGFLAKGADYNEGLNRNILGFHLNYDNILEGHVEFSNGQVTDSDVSESFANYDNKVALQQAYLQANIAIAGGRLTTQLGRLEFADAPKQLLSPGDGPNLRKNWHGAVAAFKQDQYNIEAFTLEASKPNRGWFDEVRDKSKSIHGVLAKVQLLTTADYALEISPLYIASTDLNFNIAEVIGADRRKTFGAGIQQHSHNYQLAWLLVKQIGSFNHRTVDAWAIFGQNSLQLTAGGWQPTLSVRLDIASGSNANDTGKLTTFNQLYASSGYIGQGLFFSTANLVMVTPGISFKPSARTQLKVDYGFASRRNEHDYAYAGQMRPYANSDLIAGKELGQLGRIYADWTDQRWTIFFGYEHLNPGKVLKNIDFGLSSMLFAGVSYRY